MSDVLLEAEALLEQLPEAVSRRTLGERLGKAIIELRTAGHQIQRMTALVETADIIGFGAHAHQREVLSEMVECAQVVGEALADAEDAEALRAAVYEYSTDLNRAIATLERSIRDYWRAVASERYQPLIGLGELLTSMNVANNLGPRLVACGRNGVHSANATSAADLHGSISTLSKEYNALQAERAAEIGEDEVGEFINALADKRATLAMVTPKVQAWLTEHAALDRLGVTTR
jgi:hypothetical protein